LQASEAHTQLSVAAAQVSQESAMQTRMVAREDDPLVCHCLAVAESEILVAIRGGADSVEAVGRWCEAGTACRSCHGPIHALLREEVARELAHSRAPKSLRQLSLFDELVDDSGQRRSVVPQGSHKRG
jgi:NAD(P)H-nitrite reductase large subunit